MKKPFSAVAALLIICAALYFFLNSKKSPSPEDLLSGQTASASQTSAAYAEVSKNSPGAASSSASENAAQMQQEPPSLADKAGQYIPEASPSTPLPPEALLQNVQRAIHQYSEAFGGNPVGTNPEITSQLNGDNPKHMNFVTAEAGMIINADGAMVDSWGTPLFFHQVSASEMEIHSAGPDKVMWTSDDLVVK
ncbi:MAG TPA: hypothetical protein VGO67_21300 [Verrucomicrobiae bacterium]|jgi:hypothetical protein